jgi:DNA-binding transcriptional LysR family regulator
MGQRPEGVSQQLIYKEPFVLVAPLRQEPRLRDLSLREVLKLQPLIRYGQTSHLGGQIEAHLRRIGVHAPVRLSFERSDALIAMISAGVGVAITTPLCLVQTAANWQKLGVLPLPSPGFTRSLMLMSRDRGDSQMSQHIAKVAREILGREIMPEMQARLPWLRPGPQWMVPEAEDL